MRTNGKRPRPHTGTPAAPQSPRVPRSEFMKMTLEGGAMKKVAILPGVFLVALLFSGPGVVPGSARAETMSDAAGSAAASASVAPGDVSNAVGKLAQPGTLAPAPPSTIGASAPRDVALLSNCTFTVLANDNSTSGNARAPSTRYKFA